MNDCCSIPVMDSRRDKTTCPTCGNKGKPVKALTIRYLTQKSWPNYDNITDGYLCTNPDDPTVYFFPEQNLVIDKKNVKVRVGIKEKEEPIYICYCFHHTKIAIKQDYKTHGYSTIEEDIRQKVMDKLCSCELNNPSGRCCLGDVRRTYLSSKLDMVTT